MAKAAPKRCPSCGGDMRIKLLSCPECATEIQGDYSLGRFSRLTDEQLRFLETFVRLRGNLKDLGSALSISYPTARNRLDDLILALDFEDKHERTERRIDILNQLKHGEITSEEALGLLGGKDDE